MAYLNEFPKWDSNGRNLDWILEQYSTFNQRLQEIVNEFHSTTEQMQSDIQGLETNYQRQLDLFEGRINTLVGEITRKVDSINEHTETYVNNYLSENINTILEDNPVLETKFKKIGYIDTNESVTYNLDTDVIYEVMTIDYALNMHKALAVNNAFNITQTPAVIETVVTGVLASEGSVPLDPPVTVVTSVTSTQGEISCNNASLITGTSSGNVLTITNTGSNRVRVYIKPIATL